jgi:hypothetical protein
LALFQIDLINLIQFQHQDQVTIGPLSDITFHMIQIGLGIVKAADSDHLQKKGKLIILTE